MKNELIRDQILESEEYQKIATDMTENVLELLILNNEEFNISLKKEYLYTTPVLEYQLTNLFDPLITLTISKYVLETLTYNEGLLSFEIEFELENHVQAYVEIDIKDIFTISRKHGIILCINTSALLEKTEIEEKIIENNNYSFRKFADNLENAKFFKK